MTTVVIAHESFPDTRLEEKALQAINAAVITTGNLQTEQAREIARNADALMVTIQNVDGDFIRSLDNCKIIARVGTGLDAIDIPAATACGIWVTNVSDYSIDEVSTHAIALLLHRARRLPQMLASVRSGSWYDAEKIEPAPRIKGQTLGIIGYGRIGRTVAVKARGLGLNVIAYDPYLQVGADEHEAAKLVELDTLLASADFVSLHTPLTASSRQIINAETLNKMQSTAYLINTARGELIDEAALLSAVRGGRHCRRCTRCAHCRTAAA